MQIITGANDKLSQAYAREIGRIRHRMLIEMMGWELQCREDLRFDPFDPFDPFDRPDPRHVVAKDQDECLNGCVRLGAGIVPVA